MARRRVEQVRRVLPAWLLGDWRDRAAEAAAYCAAHGVELLTVLRARAAAKAPERVRLTGTERAEVANWDVEQTDD